MPVSLQANRGRAAEELVRLANAAYRREGIAVIEKVPTEWLPIRRDGRIASAKVEHKAVADFVGQWRGYGGLAFDVKQWTSDWRLSRLEPHQADFLADWVRAGGVAFILLVEARTLRANILSWQQYSACEAAHRLGGRAALSAQEIGCLPECLSRDGQPLDYLRTLVEMEGAKNP